MLNSCRILGSWKDRDTCTNKCADQGMTCITSFVSIEESPFKEIARSCQSTTDGTLPYNCMCCSPPN